MFSLLLLQRAKHRLAKNILPVSLWNRITEKGLLDQRVNAYAVVQGTAYSPYKDEYWTILHSPPANGKMYFFHGLIKRVRSET